MTPSEQRKKVAEACCPDRYAAGIDWNPALYVADWKAIVRKVAQLIREEISRSSGYELFAQVNSRLVQFNTALATNDVPALEALCFELIGEWDE